MMIDQYLLALISVCKADRKITLFVLPEISATRSGDSDGFKAAEVMNDRSVGMPPMLTSISGNLDYALFGVPGAPGMYGDTTDCDLLWGESILSVNCGASTQLLTAPLILQAAHRA